MPGRAGDGAARRPGAATLIAGALAAAAIAAVAVGVASGQARPPGPAAAAEASITDYFGELERAGLIDVETGTKETLTAELGAAETLLRQGASIDAAVALFGIVESPRYDGFQDFVEFQNAEYYLAVALASSGAYDSALAYLDRVMERGPSSLYYAPAHRRAVDIALETRAHQRVLRRLEAQQLSEPIGPAVEGERAYLRARIAYQAGDLAAAEGQLARISRRSRLYSSALYLRGVIRARRGELAASAEALCEIADTPDTDKFTFVIDDRYFTIKDLARLGLGRLAHEQGEYDDAYYHYFQIPDDSDRLPEALFEAAWSMYQKRELATARDLVIELRDAFPSSPLLPEARLLAGYIELADCKFDEAQAQYDALVADLQPIVDEIERTRRAPQLRARLFSRALRRHRAARADPEGEPPAAARAAADRPVVDQVLDLLRVDPQFVRLHDAVSGLRRATGDAPHVVRGWARLGRRLTEARVGAVAAEATLEQEDAADADALLEDVRRLQDELARARAELRRGVREKTLPEDAAAAEAARLEALGRRVDDLAARASRAAAGGDSRIAGGDGHALAPMVRADLARARDLDRVSRELADRLTAAADQLALRALDRLYDDTRRVLDKAKLGTIDAVIGQKRSLDIQVQDLASGRYPPELHGRLWEQGLIGDDEEYWPFEGEFWADEYEGWR